MNKSIVRNIIKGCYNCHIGNNDDITQQTRTTSFVYKYIQIIMFMGKKDTFSASNELIMKCTIHEMYNT